MLKKELIYPEIYNPKLSWHVMPDDMEYISILQEQGVSNFDPIAFYREANWQKSKDIKIDESKLSKKDRKELKKKKLSKSAKKIIEDNIKKKEEILREDESRRLIKHMEDITDLDNLVERLKSMQTNYGRIKLKVQFLEYFLSCNYKLISHILFYSLNGEVTNDQELNVYLNKVISEYKERFKNEDMIQIQMNEMSSYLPPLDPLNCSPKKLDDWQLKVFNLIENKKNILLCAPTSAGKTVVSSYCAVLGNKTIFVVPSDELARQVAGIFRNLSNISVKVITNKEYFNDNDFKVLVGTPNKLEEYILLNGYDNFTYAIYDEWHMLNSDEGGAYEKIFKILKCPFLALSATLETPSRIKSWMESVKNEPVELIEYKKRFIIQQRYLWNENNLKHLHPLSCIDLEFLKNDGFKKSELSFTPRDSFDLYNKINSKIDLPIIDNKPFLHPQIILNKNKWDPITLTETIEIERNLKEYLMNISKENPEIAKKILEEYKIDDTNHDEKFDLIKLIKILIKKNMCPAIFFKMSPYKCLQVFKLIVQTLEESQNKKFPYHNDDLEFRQNYFKKFNEEVNEKRQKTKLPIDVDAEVFFKEQKTNIELKMLENMKNEYEKIILKRINKIKENDLLPDKAKIYYEKYYLIELEKVKDQQNLYYVDKNRPHPDFCFNNMGIDSNEMRRIKREFKVTLGKGVVDYDHPFMIGIERGIVPYFKDMEVPFQRIAQSLFSQKKIPIVISDESLGYGINLPIRTVVMLGEENQVENIDPVIANQMTGRSGRRGIDREGNIIFVGVNWKTILRSKFSKLLGKNPLTEDLPLPFYFNKMTKNDIDRIFKISLYDFSNSIIYNEKQKMKEILMKLKKKNSNYCRKPKNSLLIWSCRNFGSNCFYLPKAIYSILNGNQNQIFEVFACMFDNDETKLDENDIIYNMFDKNDKPDLFSGKYLLDIFKQKKIDSPTDLNRLKKIANLTSIIHTNLILNNDTKVKIFCKTLEQIFENLKNIIKKHLF
tara:strand:+ start:10 stop:3015 length:3006 start_codon:yes stop_codon:yes gene_type:complete